jgi:uncharacterized protein
MTVKCPTCKKLVEFGSPDFPFCTERCRLIDIGRWADEEFRIPAVSPMIELESNEPSTPDDDEGTE